MSLEVAPYIVDTRALQNAATVRDTAFPPGRLLLTPYHKCLPGYGAGSVTYPWFIHLSRFIILVHEDIDIYLSHDVSRAASASSNRSADSF